MEVIVVNDLNFEQVLSESSLVIAKFHAGWCGSCKLMAPKFKKLAIKDEYKSVTFIKIDSEENEKARKLAGVDNLPFFATFKNGELVEATATSKIEGVEEMLKKLNS